MLHPSSEPFLSVARHPYRRRPRAVVKDHRDFEAGRLALKSWSRFDWTVEDAAGAAIASIIASWQGARTRYLMVDPERGPVCSVDLLVPEEGRDRLAMRYWITFSRGLDPPARLLALSLPLCIQSVAGARLLLG